MVCGVCRHYSRGDDNLFADMTQEVLYRIWKVFRRNRGVWFRRMDSVCGWLFKVSLSVCKEYASQKNVIIPMTEIDSLPKSLLEDLDGQSGIIDKIDQRKSDLDIMYELIGMLSEEERGIIIHHIEGRSYNEISSLTGLSPTNVSTKLTRIRKKLIELYRKNYQFGNT